MKVRPGRCPTCGRDYAGDIESRGSAYRPRAGDLGVCISCGTMLVFVIEGNELVRSLPDSEMLANLPPDALAETERVIQFLRKKNRVGGFQS